jgi:PadR family transcriptional regulator PadR
MAKRTSSNAQLLRGTLELLLLQALSHGPLHGYAIARRIEGDSGDALSVEEGSMYPALYRLEEQGCVRAKWSMNDAGRRTRVYALTAAGRTRLSSHKKDWTAFARAVARMVGASR